MPSLRRIHRHLRIEELEPRIAPAPLVLSGTGQRSAIVTDADGDKILISLGGSRASQVSIADIGGNTPSGTNIASVTFTQANRATSLTFSFAASEPLLAPHTMPLGDILAGGLTLGSFIAPGAVNSFTADEIRLVRLSGAAGDILGPFTLSRFVGGERIEAHSIQSAGILSVNNWTGGTLILSSDLAGLVNGDNAMPGRVSVGGNITASGQVASTGLISSLIVGGNVAPGAQLSSFAGFGNVSVNGPSGFNGTLTAGPTGISSLTVGAGPLGGSITSDGVFKSLAVSGDMVSTAGVTVTSGGMNSIHIDGSVLAAGRSSAQINVTGDIGTIAIDGPSGLQGSIVATGAIGPVRITGGGVPVNPLALPNLLAGGGFSGNSVFMAGDFGGVIAATSGTITGVTAGGSFLGTGRLQNTGGGINSFWVNGPAFAGVVTASGNIGLIRITQASIGASSTITAGGGIGEIDVLSPTGDVQAGARIITGTGGFGVLNVSRDFAGPAGGLTVGGAAGITGGITIGGNLSGNIQSVGPITAPVFVGNDLTATGSIRAGSAGTAINSPITIGRDVAGLLDVSGGARAGQITIIRDVTSTGEIVGTGDLSRNLVVGRNFNGVLSLTNDQTGAVALTEGVHNTENTAQHLSLIPLGTVIDPTNRTTEVEPNNATTSSQLLVSVPIAIAGAITAGDADFYKFNVSVAPGTTQTLRFEVDAQNLGSGLISRLDLFDGSGMLLRSVDFGNTAGNPQLDPQFEYTFTSGVGTGSYFIEVRSTAASTGAGVGNYKLNIQSIDRSFVAPFNDDIPYFAGSVDTSIEEDWYSFWVDTPTLLAVDLDAALFGSPLRARIDVYNVTSGTPIATSTDGPQADPAERDPDPILSYGVGGVANTGPNADPDMNITVPGLYFVRVTSRDTSTGPYKLYVSTGTNNNWGFKTEEYATNESAITANMIRFASTTGTNVTSASLTTTVSGVMRITSTARDEDWYRMNLVMPVAGQNVTYVFNMDTYTYGPNVGEQFKYPNANLRLTVYSVATPTVPVLDINSISMDNQSEESGEIDPRIMWVPATTFATGDYFVRVSMDPFQPAQRVPSNTFYDLRISRIYQGTNRGTPGVLPESEQNRYISTAQDLNVGTNISFDLKDLGGTTDNYLSGIALQGYLDAPSSIGGVNPFASGGDLDVYRFNAIGGQELGFNVNPTINASDPTGMMNAVLTLFDSAGNVLAQNDNANFSEYATAGATGTAGTALGMRDYWPSLTAVIPKTGTYYIQVSGAQPEISPANLSPIPPSYGQYYILGIQKRGIRIPELTPLVDSIPAPGGWEVQGLDLTRTQPQTVTGAISAPTEQDKYNFQTMAGTTLSFQLFGDTAGIPLDGRLQILDSSGNLEVENTGFGPNGQPTLTFQFLNSGAYQIVVSADPTGATRTGAYTLLVAKNVADVASNIVIGGNLDAQGIAGLGLISVPGSLTGGITIGDGSGTIGDVIGNARIELGQDAVGPIVIGSLGQSSTTGAATGGVFVGGHIRPTGQVHVTGDLRDTGSLFTRFADGVPGPGTAPMWVNGDISLQAELVVAPPGGLTGRGYVFLDNAVADAGVYRAVRLFNLDNSGTLSGFFADVSRYPGALPDVGNAKAYAVSNDYVATGFTPTTGPGSPGVQVEIYYQLDRYHSYMSFLGYGSALARTVYADENEILAYQSYPNTGAIGAPGDVDYNPNGYAIRIPVGSAQSFGAMGDEMLQLYNRAVNQAMLPQHGWFYPYGPYYPPDAYYEAAAIDSGFADYRATSLLGAPWIGDARTDNTAPTLLANGYLRLADNLIRYDPSQYTAWRNAGTGIRLGGRVVTGAMWDLREVLGQQVTDTVSMLSLTVLDKADTIFISPGTYLYYVTLGPVPGSSYPSLLSCVQAADRLLFDPATNAFHDDRIRQAFAAHGIGTYGFGSTSTASGAPVGTLATLFGQPSFPGEVVTVPYPVSQQAATLHIDFDTIVTKIDFGETLKVTDNLGNTYTMVDNHGNVYLNGYTPPVASIPPDQAGNDFGRGMQGQRVDVNLNQPGLNTIFISLTTDIDSDLSLGFRAFLTDPPQETSSFQSIAGAPLSGPLLVPSSSPGPSSSLQNVSLELLQLLLGTISETTTSSTASVASGAPTAQVLTVNDIARASEPVNLPPAASLGDSSLQVYATITEAADGSSASTVDVITLQPAAGNTIIVPFPGAYETIRTSVEQGRV